MALVERLKITRGQIRASIPGVNASGARMEQLLFDSRRATTVGASASGVVQLLKGEEKIVNYVAFDFTNPPLFMLGYFIGLGRPAEGKWFMSEVHYVGEGSYQKRQGGPKAIVRKGSAKIRNRFENNHITVFWKALV